MERKTDKTFFVSEGTQDRYKYRFFGIIYGNIYRIIKINSQENLKMLFVILSADKKGKTISLKVFKIIDLEILQ